jgi:D-arabinose 1-dehydrogenase-like Zn-dependent alcohol dehydrogenase
MKALWLENQQLHLHTDLPIPTLPAGEARMRVLPMGICNTDLELLRNTIHTLEFQGMSLFAGALDSL